MAKKKTPVVDFASLVRDMEECRDYLDPTPSAHFTKVQLDYLEDIRHNAINLAKDIEAIFEELGE
jgi:hypothetical protein